MVAGENSGSLNVRFKTGHYSCPLWGSRAWCRFSAGGLFARVMFVKLLTAGSPAPGGQTSGDHTAADGGEPGRLTGPSPRSPSPGTAPREVQSAGGGRRVPVWRVRPVGNQTPGPSHVPLATLPLGCPARRPPESPASLQDA